MVCTRAVSRVPAVLGPGVVQEEWGMGDLIIGRHPVLSPAACSPVGSMVRAEFSIVSS